MANGFNVGVTAREPLKRYQHQICLQGHERNLSELQRCLVCWGLGRLSGPCPSRSESPLIMAAADDRKAVIFTDQLAAAENASKFKQVSCFMSARRQAKFRGEHTHEAGWRHIYSTVPSVSSNALNRVIGLRRKIPLSH